MMIPTQYLLMMPIGQFGGGVRHLDAGGAARWRCPMRTRRSPWGLARWCMAWNVEVGVCDHGGDNICVLLNHIGEMIGVIERLRGP